MLVIIYVSPQIRMLADPKAELTKALELQTDLPPLGGIRSKRYSMVIEDGVIKSLNVEPDGTGLTCSLAEKITV
jgi:2-Cys peroxiredoxin 5